MLLTVRPLNVSDLERKEEPMFFKMDRTPCHSCQEPTGFVCGNCEKPTCEWCSHPTTKRGRLCDQCYTGCGRCGLTDVHIVDCSSEFESLCEECAVVVNGPKAQEYIDHLHNGGTRDNFQPKPEATEDPQKPPFQVTGVKHEYLFLANETHQAMNPFQLKAWLKRLKERTDLFRSLQVQDSQGLVEVWSPYEGSTRWHRTFKRA